MKKNFLFAGGVFICMTLLSCGGLLVGSKNSATLSFSINLAKSAAPAHYSRAALIDDESAAAVKVVATLYGASSNKEYVYTVLDDDEIKITIERVAVGTSVRVGVDIYDISAGADPEEMLRGFGESAQFTVLQGANSVQIKLRDPLIVTLDLRGGEYKPLPRSTWQDDDDDDDVYTARIREGSTLTQNGLANPVRAGYEIKGWNVEGNPAFTKDTPINTPLNISARWSDDPSVIFIANGGTGLMPEQLIAIGDTANLELNAFTREGYTFNEWNTDPNGSGDSYDDGDPFTMPVGGDKLYAQWQPIEFDAAYYAAHPEFPVATPEQLIQLADLSNDGSGLHVFAGKTIRLVSDINFDEDSSSNFDGLAVGSYGLTNAGQFKGTFDGGGFTIWNMRIDNQDEYVGLIGYAFEATIKSLMLGKDCSIKGDGFVGIIGYASFTSITSVVNDMAKITSNTGSENNVGGIVGKYSTDQTSPAGINSKITSCINRGEVSGKGNVGGIVGDASNQGGLLGAYQIIDCVNEGKVTGSEAVGGIAGKGGGITKSYNTAEIIGSKAVGGIIGDAVLHEVSASYNMGKISASAAGSTPAQYFGGVAGRTTVKIEKSYNTGEVVFVSGPFGEDFGGIAGRVIGHLPTVGSIENCYNTGNIDAASVQTVGGIAGYINMAGANSIKNNYNIGRVTASSSAVVGGIIGESDGTPLTPPQIQDNFWTSKSSSPAKGIGNPANDGGAQKLSAPEISLDYKYTNWDFSTIWEMRQGLPLVNGVSQRPVLRGIGQGK